MSVYFCHGCNQYKDADIEGVEENPISGENICECCFEDFLGWADYRPEDFE